MIARIAAIRLSLTLVVGIVVLGALTGCREAERGRVPTSPTSIPSFDPASFFYPVGDGSKVAADWHAGCEKLPGCDSAKPYFLHEYHLGDDLLAPAGAPVVPIADGLVTYVSGPTERSGWGRGNYGVVVRHTLPNGIAFYALYGHIVPDDPRLRVPDSKALDPPIALRGGVAFAHVGALPDGPTHIHFGIIPSASLPQGSGECDGWGRRPLSCWTADASTRRDGGFVSPVRWLSERAALAAAPASAATIVAGGSGSGAADGQKPESFSFVGDVESFKAQIRACAIQAAGNGAESQINIVQGADGQLVIDFGDLSVAKVSAIAACMSRAGGSPAPQPGGSPPGATSSPSAEQAEVLSCISRILGAEVAARIEAGTVVSDGRLRFGSMTPEEGAATARCFPNAIGPAPGPASGLAAKADALACISKLLGPEVAARVESGTMISGSTVRFGAMSAEEREATAMCFPNATGPTPDATSGLAATKAQALACIAKILGPEVAARVEAGTVISGSTVRFGAMSAQETAAAASCFAN